MMPRTRLPPGEARRLVAVLTLAVFCAACTSQQARPPLELHHFRVDWEHAGAQELDVQGVQVQALLLTPTQWPLEGSVKRLLQGDFIGVIDAFDLRFRSSTIPPGILEDLYDRGFVPAYLRVENRSTEGRAFQPSLLVVRDRAGQELPAADPQDLPATFTRVDMERTLLAAAGVVLVVVAIVAAQKGQLNLSGAGDIVIEPSTGPVYVGVQRRSAAGVYVDASVGIPAEPGETESSEGGPSAATGADRSLLRAEVLAPGEAREGVILFIHKNATVDWKSAVLTVR